uniref:Protein muscleblind n=1 Tax=Cacopsylla melanoneura TaxID=428564 RepID=A0A8D8U891_9HEMI
MFQGRCNREKPPCKYFHPPQHLKDQLLINGRNHLALKNALLQQMGLTPPGQPMLPGQMPTVATTPYLAAGMTQVGNTFSPYFSPAGPLMPTMMTQDPNNSLALVQQNAVAQQKIARTDRIEMDMKGVGSFYYDNFSFPGMMPFKRPAGDKSGVPVYQPNAAAYQQLLQPFVPVSFTGHPPGIPRF